MSSLYQMCSLESMCGLSERCGMQRERERERERASERASGREKRETERHIIIATEITTLDAEVRGGSGRLRRLLYAVAYKSHCKVTA